MAISKRTLDAAWHQTNVREKDYFRALAEVSLANKNIKNPNFFQIEIETLFLSYRFLRDPTFYPRIATQELKCLLLSGWGYGVEAIAEILEVKEDSTIKLRSKLAEKLNAKNITHAVYKATQAGILNLNNVDFLLYPKKKNSSQTINKTVASEKELENAFV